MIDISEFLENVKEWILSGLIESLQNACITMYLNIFDQANTATEQASATLKLTPEAVFPTVYTIVTNVSETVFFPIAGIILMFVLCYESLSMLAENNRMKEFGPQDVYILVFKILIGILLLANSIELVNKCFEIGEWAVTKAGIETSNANLNEGLDAASYIESCTDIFAMIGYLLLGCIVKIGVSVFSVMIKIAVWLRFVELYMFLVSAPIPFSTFLNKELSQVGWNYIRKILALAFQPIYMILCFSIFTGTLTPQPGADLLGTLGKAFAAMVILIMALFKTRTIADSIFNAH